MANIQYADPFGSYVKGQQAGTEDTIRTGIAARQFRAMDLSPEVQRWYLPLKQQEAQNELEQRQLALHLGQQKNAANLTAYGAPGNAYNAATLAKLYPGMGFENATANSQLDLTRAAREGSGELPSAYDPLFATGGGALYKNQMLTDEQHNKVMQQKYGPNWKQQMGESGAGHTPEFDPYGAATNGMFEEPGEPINQAAPTSLYGAPQAQQEAPDLSNKPMDLHQQATYPGTGDRQPHHVWMPMGAGGVDTGEQQ